MTAERTQVHIHIVGAGMGGLSAALGLLRQGHDVRIFEQASAFGEVGAGVTVGAGAILGLDYLGLGDVFDSMAEPPGRASFIHYATIEPIPGPNRVNDTSLSSRGTMARRIHRADLHAILARAVMELAPGSVTFGVRLENVTQTENAAICHFNDGTQAQADAVIAADGVRSVARRVLFGAASPRFTGKVAWRCLIPNERIAAYLRNRMSSLFIGPDAMMTAYSVRQGSLINIAAMVRTDSWTDDATRVASSIDELLPYMPGWHPDIEALLREAPPGSVTKWALYDYDPMTGWTKGRITLLGDAAHPLLPFLGAGASMAIEDAVILSRALAGNPNAPEALLRYEHARIDRTSRMMLASRRQGENRLGGDPGRYLADSPFRDNSLFLYDPVNIAF